ncbi:glycosyltransferase [Shigella sonnei]|uniref:glycosyltransferase family 8 protein n=1 Tax=Shigella sonnei TaxID=624 RepID=UPI001C8BD963|nr:glycosyltransferase [Shigella sonnei]MBX8766285.1 glycosyltransferase [Shigella sonnei]MBX8809332.1 glycosyltransferase [Shigella sonnei]
MDLLAESITEVAVSGEIANTDRVLNIAYGIDRNFLFGAAVSMQSVVMHNPDLAVKFHLFTDYIDEDYLQRVNAFTSKNANVEVRIYKVSSAFIDIFPSLKQWSYATFFRLVAFQYLSETIENLLYIDADVICKGSLAGLLDINFDGDKFAAVIKDVPFMQEKPAKRLAIEGLPGNYFNAGVVYLQLEAWAKNDFMNKAIAMLASDPQHTKYKCLDQDILNILFFGHCIFISGDYDCFYGIDYELKNKSDEDYKKTITDDTKLIHYVGVTKPWNDWTNYPCQKYFNEAYQASCWNDVEFIPATNEKQYQVKYQHAKKNGDTFNAFIYFIKFKLNKYKRKLFG